MKRKVGIKMKKFVSLLLVLVLVIGAVPLQVLGFEASLLENGSAINAVLLEQLKSYYGDDVDEYLKALEELGFIDEDGNLKVSENIVVDGEEMSLEEIEAMINHPDTDLSKVVTVDNYPVTLEDLRLMIEIEKEVARIYTTYYTEKDWTDEQLTMLSSLNDAAADGSLLMSANSPMTFGNPADTSDWNDLGVQKHNATLSVTNKTVYTSDTEKTEEIELTVSGAEPSSQISGKLTSLGTTADSSDYSLMKNSSESDIVDFVAQADASGNATVKVEIKIKRTTDLAKADNMISVDTLIRAYDLEGVSNSIATGVLTITAADFDLNKLHDETYSTEKKEITVDNFENSHEMSETAKTLLNLGVFSKLVVTPNIYTPSSFNYSTGGLEITYYENNGNLYLSDEVDNHGYSGINSTFGRQFSSGSNNLHAINYFNHNWLGRDKEIYKVRHAYGVDMNVDLVASNGNAEELIGDMPRGLNNAGAAITQIYSSSRENSAELPNVIRYPSTHPISDTVKDAIDKLEEEVADSEQGANGFYQFQWSDSTSANIDTITKEVHENVAKLFWSNDGAKIYPEEGNFSPAHGDYFVNVWVGGVADPVDTYLKGVYFDKIKDEIDFSEPYETILTQAQRTALADGSVSLSIKPFLEEVSTVVLSNSGGGDSTADINVTTKENELWGYNIDTKVEYKLVDEVLPTVVSATAVSLPNSGMYNIGDLVPVIVTFSEPVAISNATAVGDAAYSPTLTVTGSYIAEFSSEDMSQTLTDYQKEHVFYFPVRSESPGSYEKVNFGHFTTITDVAGNAMERVIQDINLAAGAPYVNVTSVNNAIDSVDAVAILASSAGQNDRVDVTVNVFDGELQKLIADSTVLGEINGDSRNKSTVINAKITYKDTSNTVKSEYTDLFFNVAAGAADLGTELIGTVEISDLSATDREVLVEVCEIDSTAAENHIVIAGKFSAVSFAELVYITADDIIIDLPLEDPADPDGFMEEKIVEVNGEDVATYEFSMLDIIGEDAKEASFTIDLKDMATIAYTFPEDFEITSSDEDVLKGEIDTLVKNKVNLTVGGEGEATITVKAANGGHDAGEETSVELNFSVFAGTVPFIAVQSGQDKLEKYIGSPFSVNFLSNLCEKTLEGESTSFTLLIKDGSGDEVYTETLTYDYGDKAITNFSVPADAITVTGDYTATVTTDFEGLTPNTLDYEIEIIPNPVVATLSYIGDDYITDATESITVNWELENWDDGKGEFSLSLIGEDETTELVTAVPTADSGSVNITIPDVTPTTSDFRDIYTISLKAKNDTDETISQDSILLFVYPDDLVKLYVTDDENEPNPGNTIAHGKDIDLTLSNRDEIETLSQDAILDLERDIQLEAYLHTNYVDYDYGQGSDQFTWDVQSDGDVSVAEIYKYLNSAYYDITTLTNSTFMPDEVMLLAGENDGTGTVNVTHANVDDSALVNLTVETLREHLYLIDAYPNAQVEYSYESGNGNTVTGTSNSEGKIAIYDPSGIKGDVYLESEVSGEKYFGTIFNEDLLSGENNSAYNVLYPENYIELRKATKADIYLKDEVGNDFTGDVIIRGGVYRNGEYISEAKFSVNGSALQSGYEDIQSTVSSSQNGGLVSIEMDITQFVTSTQTQPVTITDDIKYVFEVYAQDKYPIVIYEDPIENIEDIEDTGNFVYFLNSADEEGAFIGLSSVGYINNSVQMELDKDIHYVGPSDEYDTVHLNTSVYWWGSEYESAVTNAGVDILDKNGRSMINQTVTTTKHEFSDMWISTNITPFDEAQMANIGLLPKEYTNIQIDISKDGNQSYKVLTLDQQVINLLGLKSVAEDEDLSKNLDTIADLRVDGDIDSTIINNEEMFTTGLQALTKLLSFTMGEPVEILFEPTADPLVYTALISKNANQSDVGYGDTGTEHTVSVNILDPSLNRSKSKASVLDKHSMASGSFQEKADKDINNVDELLRGNLASGGRVIFVPPSLGGYIEAEFRYDPQADKWDMELVSGGLSGDTSVGYRYSWNMIMGGIPLTTSVEMGVILGVAADFQSGEHYERDEFIQTGPNSSDYILPEAEKGVDILTELRVSLYFELFGGVGFDMSVIALKAGIFGRMEGQFGFRWLNRPYLGDENFEDEYYIPEVLDHTNTDVTYDEVLSAGDIELKGRVGLRVEGKFGPFEKTYELFSVDFAGYNTTWGQWNAISDIWLRNDRVNGNPISQVTIGGAEMFSLDYGLMTESRSYLEVEERSYGVAANAFSSQYMPMSFTNLVQPFALDLDIDSKFPAATWTNIYPHSTPLISDDGKIMVYIDDNESTNPEDTRVKFSQLNGGTYNEGTLISGVMVDDGTGAMVEQKSYGDMQLNIDGNSSGLVAAYVRQVEEFGKDSDEVVSNEEAMQMLNLSEIYVSSYDGTTWTTERITENATIDLAPVVATNGSKTIVAWREVEPTDYSNPTNFDGLNRVVYKIKENGSWSETKVLYDGSKGDVMSISADMLADGTATVVYSYDESTSSSSDMEIAAAIIKNSGVASDNLNGDNSVTIINLTNDDSLNQNVQLTTANIDGEEHFVIGWYNQTVESKTVTDDAGFEEVMDYEVPEVRFMALDKDGAVNGSIPESLSKITANSSVEVSSDFIFSKNSDNITDLALAWVDVSEAGSISADGTTFSAATYTINSAKFIQIDGKYAMSAVSEIAEMPENVVPAHFDFYKTSTDSYNAVILGTDYDTGVVTSKQTYLTTTNAEGEPVTEMLEVPSAVTTTNMYSATHDFINSVRNDGVYVDFEEVRPNDDIDISFTLTNTGKEAITKVDIKIDTQTVTFDNLNIAPGQTTTLHGEYVLGATIENLDYTTKAYFTGGGTAEQVATVYIEYPDVSISDLELVEEKDGLRKINFSLNNSLNIPLENSGKRVIVELYSSSEYTQESKVDSVNAISISTNEELALIDAGAYTSSFNVDVNKLLAEINLDEDGKVISNPWTELPDGGVELYAKVWIEANNAGELYEQNELYLNDNFASVNVLSLLEKNGGAPVSISTQLTHSGNTTAQISVLNNSLSNVTTGNLHVQLLDEQGEVIETMQSYSKGSTNNGLITLGGEEEVQETFSFTKQGASVVASYGELVDTSGTQLSSISIKGVPLDINSFDEQNNAVIVMNSIAEKTAAMNIMAKSTSANIELISGISTDLNSDSNIYAGNVDLSSAVNEIQFSVKSGGETAVYTIKIYDAEKFSMPVIQSPVTSDGVTSVEITVLMSDKNQDMVAYIPDEIMEEAVGILLAEAAKQNTAPKLLVNVISTDESLRPKAQFSGEALNELTKQSGAMFEVKSSAGSVLFDAKATDKMLLEANGEELTIVLAIADELTNEQKASIGTSTAYEVSVLTKSGKTISDFGEGQITISLKYALQANEKAENVKVYKVFESGESSERDTTYVQLSELAIFTTNTLSVYMVRGVSTSTGTDTGGTDTDGADSTPDAGDNTNMMLPVIMLILSSLAILILSIKRKKQTNKMN